MEKTLDKGGFLDLSVRNRTVVMARGGRYWLTRTKDRDDYLLDDGEALALPKGKWLLQALDGGTLAWTDEVSVPQKIDFGRSPIEASCLPSLSGI